MIDLAPLDNDLLLTSLKRLTGTSNELTAQMLAHLAEVEARKLHVKLACASLCSYCVYELRMSEDEAQRRCRAARICRQFPLLYEMLADASIHLTGILLLGPVLTGANHREVLARARYRTKREIEKLVAELAPRTDVPARIEPLHIAPRPKSDHATMMAALCGPVRRLQPGNGPGAAPVGALAELELASEASVPSPASLAEPEAQPAPARPMHYKVQFTADQPYVDLLEEARNLLAHVNPTRDFVEVHRRALELLVAQLRKRKHASRAGAAATSTDAQSDDSNGADAPSTERTALRTEARSSGVHVSEEAPVSEGVSAPARRDEPVLPLAADTDEEASTAAPPARLDSRAARRARRPSAAIARAVWERDEGRCTYVDERGRRCRETSMLEYHHEHAWALGGTTTLENLTLRCRAHNTLAAENDFGREHMRRKQRCDVDGVPTR